jgi:peroxiredoxin family protein
MKKLITTVLLSSFSSSALAECKAVTPVNAGEIAPCSGFIFSPEQELKVRLLNEDNKFSKEQIKVYLEQKEFYKKELELTEQIIELEKQKTEAWKVQAEKSSEQLIKMQERQSIRDWVFLTSGVLITVAAGYAVGQVAKSK